MDNANSKRRLRSGDMYLTCVAIALGARSGGWLL